MSDWAAAELQYADLGDVRRKKRLIRLVSDLAAQQERQHTPSIGRLGSDPSCL